MSYEENIKRVAGDNRGELMLFTLSTCVWCRKTKALLDGLGVEYQYVDVDTVKGEDGEDVVAEMHKYNPNTSFPTIVLNKGEKVILGFEEDQIRECVQ